MTNIKKSDNNNSKPEWLRNLLTKREVCEFLGISISTCEKRQKRGEIAPTCRYNGKNMYETSDITELKSRMTTQF